MNKIYLSGKISGTDLEKTKIKFSVAHYEINTIYRYTHAYFPTVINPTKLGLTFKDSWLKCMIICIWHLLKCRSIYMLKDWKDGRGAKIEFWIAVVLNYKIIFQEND